MENKFDPNNRPERGAALFRWMLEKNKWEAENPNLEEVSLRDAAIKKLRDENAKRGTAIVNVQR